jgi:sugar lactone lactonase YvrE
VAQDGKVLERVRTSQRTLSCVVGGMDGRTLFAATVASDDPETAARLNAGRIEMVRL